MKYLLFTDCANLGVGVPKEDETVKTVKPEHFEVYKDIHGLKEKLLLETWYKGDYRTTPEKTNYINNFFANISNMEINKLIKLEGITLNDYCCQYFIYRTDDEPENVRLTFDDIETMFPIINK